MKPKQEHLYTRREALKGLGAGALLTMGLWPGAARAGIFGWGNHRDFTFIEVNDIHHMDDECGRWFEGVVRGMKTHDAQFCLVVGDLADDGTRAHLDEMRELLHGLRMPFYPVMGNHDYLTQTDRAAYEDVFPKRLNYHFEHHGWQFVGLDSTEGQHYQDTEISPDTLRWVDDHLKRLSKKNPTVIFTHFPMGAGVKYRPKNADALLERFREYNLQAVYNGHYHAFTEREAGNTVVTTDRCCALKRFNHDGTKEKGYFVCAIKDGVIHREFVECAVG
jgi:3',5'-cyclic AMP phosphodiesterase CpdA